MKKTILFLFALIAITYGCSKPAEPNRETLQQPVLTVHNSNDTVYFSWKKVPAANKYEVFFKNPKIASNYFVLAQNLSDTTAFSTTFYPATRYQAWARAIDTIALNMSPAAVAVEFTAPCMPFSTLTLQGITQSSATVSWMGNMPNDRSDIISFSMLLRIKGSQDFATYTTDNHGYTFNQLAPATDYEVKLSFVCTDGKNYATDWKPFRTL